MVTATLATAHGHNQSTDVLGVHVDALTMQSAIDAIEGWVERGERTYVCFCTVHTVMECQRDPALREAVNGAGAAHAGRHAARLALPSRRAHQVERVYGPDLMLGARRRSARDRPPPLLLRRRPRRRPTAGRRISERFPGLHIAGTHTPPMLPVGARESAATIESINASGADVVWVSLGTPKQDWWVSNHRPLLTAPVIIAVGAAFDFHTGRVRQAPGWMQRSGLEWLFRLTQDPSRLWHRYIVVNARFVLAMLREYTGSLAGTSHR